MSVFVELSIILVIATVISLIMRLLRQPFIVGYIITGILAGPYVLNILQSHGEMELFAKIGIAILLFILGLTLNPDIIKEVGKTSFIIGVGQITLTSLIGFLLVRVLGFNLLQALYIAVALTFSSTIIVLKLLNDIGDNDKLYGKISMGLLLVQDLVAVIIFLAITTISNILNSGEITSFLIIAKDLFIVLLYGGLTTLFLYFISKYFLTKLFNFVGGNQEILFIFSIAWGLGFASFFFYLGLSIEIGALIAGIMLAVSPFAYEIGAKLKPLRDFFIIIFFILLGSQIVLSSFFIILTPALILSLFVLIGNPLIVYMLLNLLKYPTRTAFMAGLIISQVSVFSLILVTLGYSLGHISEKILSIITLVTIITIIGSTYLVHYADFIYSKIYKFLKFIAIYKHTYKKPLNKDSSPEVIIFGYDRVGYSFVSVVRKMTEKYLVVDYNPKSISALKKDNIPYKYGDAEDLDFIEEIGFKHARLVISTIPGYKINLLLVKYYRKTSIDGIIIMIAHNIKEAEELYSFGASYVVMPHHLGAQYATNMINKHGFNSSGFMKEKEIHLLNLLKEKNLSI